MGHITVVHFILDPRVGGPHAYVSTLRRALEPTVVSTIATAGRGPMSDVAFLNFRQYARLLYPFEVLANVSLIALYYGLRRRPALFHVHGAANLAPVLAAWFCRIPVVWQFHETLGVYTPLARIGAWLLGRVPHRLLTVARSACAGFSQQQVQLVPGLVDTSYWQPDADGTRKDDRGEKKIPLRLVTVANLNPLKGVDVLLEALPQVGEPLELTVIGSELDTHRKHVSFIRESVRKLKGTHPTLSVELAGARSHEHIRSILAQADVYVLPSRSEACPIALLEAMAMAKPCVATDVGGVRDILPTEQQPFVCPPGDPVKLATAIRSMMALGSETRRYLGTKNRRIVQMHHAPLKIARLIHSTYSVILGCP